MLRRPFSCHLLFTVVTNFAGAALAIVALVVGTSCSSALTGWLIAFCVMCGAHISFGFYTFRVLATTARDDGAGAGSSAKHSMRRLNTLVCYDPLTAVYILVFVGSFVGQCLAVGWLREAQCVGPAALQAASSASVLMWVFLAAAGVSFAAGVLHLSCASGAWDDCCCGVCSSL